MVTIYQEWRWQLQIDGRTTESLAYLIPPPHLHEMVLPSSEEPFLHQPRQDPRPEMPLDPGWVQGHLPLPASSTMSVAAVALVLG